MVVKSTGPQMVYKYATKSLNLTGLQCRLGEAIGNVSSPVQAVTVYRTTGETITYETGRQHINSCDHRSSKVKYVNPNVVCGKCKRGTGSLYKYHYAYARKGWEFTPTAPPDVLNVLDYFTPAEIENWRALAWGSIYPDINDGLSMINFLWELKEIPQLLRLATTVKNFLGYSKKVDPLSKTVAEVTLSYSYGIAPLIDDLVSIAKLIQVIKKRVREFQAEGRKLQSYHYRKVIDSSETPVDKMSYSKITTKFSLIYYATARLTYEYKPPNNLEAMFRMWGLHLTKASAWNAMPWSFLVDYVYKVSKALEASEKDPYVHVRLHEYCDTFKVSSKNVCSMTSDTTFFADAHEKEISEDQVCWEYEKKHYLRTPCMPNTGYALPYFDSLSKRELVLVGALARTNLMR